MTFIRAIEALACFGVLCVVAIGVKHAIWGPPIKPPTIPKIQRNPPFSEEDWQIWPEHD